MQFREDRWLGNRWAAIDIEPVSEAYFLPLLFHLAITYGFKMPRVIDGIDMYIADFEITGSKAMIHIDPWTFSIAFEDENTRDQVLETLQALPDNYFEPPATNCPVQSRS